jgi:hypothetical protein
VLQVFVKAKWDPRLGNACGGGFLLDREIDLERGIERTIIAE